MPRRRESGFETQNENIDSLKTEIDSVTLRTTARVFADAAARDAFYPNNLDLLNQGVTRILLQDGGAGSPIEQIWNGATSPASYVNTNWVSLPAGATLTGPQIKTLYEGNPDTNALEDVPASILQLLSLSGGVVVSSASWQFPPERISLGAGIQISNAVRTLNVRTMVPDDRSVVLTQSWNTSTGFQEPFVYDDTGFNDLDLNDPIGSDVSNTANFQITTTADQLIYRVSIPTNQISQTLAGTLQIRINAADGPIEYSFDDNVTTDSSGNAVVDLENPIVVDNAMVLFVTGTLQGMIGVTSGQSFTPNATVSRLLVTRIPIATFNQQQQEVTSSVTINTSNLPLYERKQIVIPSSVASPITITFEDGLSFDFFDIYNNSNQTLTLTSGGSELIHGEATLDLTQYQGGRIRRIDASNLGLVFVINDPGMVDDYVDGASFDQNVLTLTRTGTLPDLQATVPLATATNAGAMSAAQAAKLDGIVGGTTPRTDEDIFNVFADSLRAGNNVQLSRDDTNNTMTISFSGGSGTPPPAPADTIYYGLSSANNPGTVDITGLTQEQNPTSPDTISTGLASAGDYFILLVPQADDITSIFDTVNQIDVTSLFTETDNVRTISTVSYKSYVVGPLNAGVNEQYVITFGS